MLTFNEKPVGKFVNILADGLMRLVVTEETVGAKKRDYETSSGEKGTKYELVFTELTGMIEKIGFWEGDYGKLIQITVKDGEEEPIILSISTSGSFGEELMKKLPNVDLKKAVKIIPYSFIPDGKKNSKKGINIYQGDIKLGNYYYDEDTKKATNGYPNPKVTAGKKPSKDFWRKFFAEARDFMIADTIKRFNVVEESKDEDF